MLAALLAAFAATGIAIAGPALPAPFAVLDLSSMFSSYFSATSWYALAALLAVAVIAAAAFVYMLGTASGSQKAALWAKTQIYEALVGIAFIAIFFALYSWLLTNPQAAFGAANLVPSQCTGTADIYALSTCDLGTFLSTSNDWFSFMFYASYLSGMTLGFKAGFSSAAGSVTISTEIKSLMPVGMEETMAILMDLLLPTIMLNEVQMILLSAAPLIFAMLIALGVFAWMVGFSRRFGGTMIALAIGIGVVYPLLVSVTYGFIQVRIAAIISDVLSQLAVFAAGFFAGLVSLQYGNIVSLAATLFSGGSYVFAGLVLVPALNFMILDAFIVDFSKAIGLRVTFMELLSNLV